MATALTKPTKTTIKTGTPATATIQTPPEQSGAVLASFKNAVFLTREHSQKERGPVYVVRLIIGDLYRVRYADDTQGYFLTERDARRMFDRVVKWATDSDLWEALASGPSDGSLVVAFDY